MTVLVDEFVVARGEIRAPGAEGCCCHSRRTPLFSFLGMINTLPKSFSPACQSLDAPKSSFEPNIFIQQHKNQNEYLLGSQAINHSFSFKPDLSDFSILFCVRMSNFRTTRQVKLELPYSGFLTFTQKEKPSVANCPCDSFVAGTDEKKIFFSWRYFEDPGPWWQEITLEKWKRRDVKI